MPTKTTPRAAANAAPAPASAAKPTPVRVTLRVLKNGVHAGRLILGKGAVVTLPQEEAAALINAGSAHSLH